MNFLKSIIAILLILPGYSSFTQTAINNNQHDLASKKTPVDFVYPYIGTINPKTRSTTPVIKVPGGNVGLFPSFTPEMEDLYLADKIYGFPLGFGSLMINTGNINTGAKENASSFDHDLETATPYYYQVLLEDPDINTEFTLTDNTVLFRFTFTENAITNLLLRMQGNANIEVKNKNVLQGSSVSKGRGVENTKKSENDYGFMV